jgi:hypothetical protein
VFQNGEWGGGCVGEEDDEEEWQETHEIQGSTRNPFPTSHRTR